MGVFQLLHADSERAFRQREHLKGCLQLYTFGWKLPQYVILGNYTEQGIRTAKESIKRDEDTRRMVSQAGGKLQIYYTFGEYDFVALVEMPSDEAMLKLLLVVGKAGNVRTKTLKAYTESEAHKVMSQLP